MKWRWQDVDDLPADVYADLIDWLANEGGEASIDMDALSDE